MDLVEIVEKPEYTDISKKRKFIGVGYFNMLMMMQRNGKVLIDHKRETINKSDQQKDSTIILGDDHPVGE